MGKRGFLAEIKKKMERDESLPLRTGATNLVFGVGNPDTKILLVGEGPGYWEDQRAEPFVGNAGKLLDSLLAEIKLSRNEVFITNVVHHRPPENRDPHPMEIEAYKPYLDRIIEIINPKVIVTLGRFSMGKFIPNSYISSIHGKPHRLNWKGRNIAVVPMYHPAAALRSTEIMRLLREDFQKLPEILREAKKEEIKQMELM